MMKAGDVLTYFYLWRHQAAQGEESGRKARPVCLAVVSKSRPETLFLFPITSQQPEPDRPAFALSEIECRRARLRFPSWLILDEYNRTKAQHANDFDDLEPIGSLSPATLRTVLMLIRQLQKAGAALGIDRD